MKKKLKRAAVGGSREIWCSDWETGRFDEILGNSQENRESWQVCSLIAIVLENVTMGHLQLCA